MVIFQRLTIFDVLSHRAAKSGLPLLAPLHDVPDTANLDQVLETLRQHQVSALPVYKQGGPSKVYSGIISAYDVAGYSVFQKVFQDIDREPAYDESTSLRRHLVIMEDTNSLINTKAKTLLEMSEESRSMTTLQLNDPLSALLFLFSHSRHRTIVVDRDSNQATMVTQTDLIEYLNDKRADLTKQDASLNSVYTCKASGIMDTVLKGAHQESRDTPSHVFWMPADEKALSGFRLLYLYGVNALAIIDKKNDGKLVGNLSASDLKGMTKKNLEDLELPVMEFLEKVGKQPGMKKGIVTCSANDEVGGIMREMLKDRIHRVWVVDDAFKPQGCVRMSDVLDAFGRTVGPKVAKEE